MFDLVTNVQPQNDSFCEMVSACTIANGSRSPITLVYYPFLEEAWCPEEQTGSHKKCLTCTCKIAENLQECTFWAENN